jgi:hypothetical protein
MFLIHYVHRDEVVKRLRLFIEGYEKGSKNVFAQTRSHLDLAIQRGATLKKRFNRLPGNEPYTDVHDLVQNLRNLKNI